MHRVVLRLAPSGPTFLGHRRIASTVRNLGIEIYNAIKIAEKIEI